MTAMHHATSGVRSMRIAFTIALMLGCATPAVADLMLYPTRVVFDERTRTAQIDLVNTADKPVTYRIGFERKRMDAFGAFSIIDTPLPGEQFADEMIRYSPRQVTLAPRAGQMVRLLLRKPPDLAPGEYRSHLVFERVPDAPADAAQDEINTEMQIRLSTLVSVSIPVIVQQGASTATVDVSTPHLVADGGNGKPAIAFDVKRAGDRSVYGDLSAYYTPQGGQPELVAQANGVAIYAPYPTRHVKLTLRDDAPVMSPGGQLRIEYRARPEQRRVLLASAEVDL